MSSGWPLSYKVSTTCYTNQPGYKGFWHVLGVCVNAQGVTVVWGEIGWAPYSHTKSLSASRECRRGVHCSFSLALKVSTFPLLFPTFAPCTSDAEGLLNQHTVPRELDTVKPPSIKSPSHRNGRFMESIWVDTFTCKGILTFRTSRTLLKKKKKRLAFNYIWSLQSYTPK